MTEIRSLQAFSHGGLDVCGNDSSPHEVELMDTGSMNSNTTACTTFVCRGACLHLLNSIQIIAGLFKTSIFVITLWFIIPLMLVNLKWAGRVNRPSGSERRGDDLRTSLGDDANPTLLNFNNEVGGSGWDLSAGPVHLVCWIWLYV
jgi:hypothetical protein